MIDTLANLLFRCGHRQLTRPITPRSEPGTPYIDTYVVCLDCGKQFLYDREEGKVLKFKNASPPETSQWNQARCAR